MEITTLLQDAEKRSAALRAYNILHTQAEQDFDDITQLATEICGSKMALISLIDGEKLWYKSRIGLEITESPLATSFCVHAVQSKEQIFIINEAQNDERFNKLPFLDGNSAVSFYAGVPLINDEGIVLGTLCTFDYEPRLLSQQQQKSLQALARQTINLLELRKQKNEVEKKNQLLEKLFEQNLDLLIIIDTKGKIIKLNKEWNELLGYIPNDLLGKQLLEYVHPDYLQSTLQAFSQLSRQEKVLNFVNLFKRRDGGYLTLEWRAYAENGNIFASARDITLRTQKDAEIRRLSNLLNDAQSIANLGAWELDLTTNKTIWTEEVYKIHEVDRPFEHDKEVGINFYHPEDKHIIIEAINNAIIKKEPFDVTCRLITAKGNLKWVRASGRIEQEHQKASKLIGIFQDITAKQIEERQKEYNRKLLEGLYELSPIGIALNDMQTGKFLEVNKKMVEPSGFTKEEFLTMSYWDMTPVEYHQKEADAIAKLKNKTWYGPFEKEYFKKDGTRYSILVKGVVITDTHGEKRMWSFVEDITERKQAEKELKFLLNLSNSQNERLKNFAHIVSHNLRSHSGNIHTLIDFLLEEQPALHNSENTMMLKLASENLIETISHLSEIALVNATDNLQLTQIDISVIISKAINSLNAIAQKANVKIINNVTESYTVLGFAAYLDSIVLNFLSNAIKYSDPEKDSYVKLSGIEKANQFILTIEDNGLGIDLITNGNKLFGLYKTFHGHKDARGIGLFITRNQIESMGGSVEVSSEVKKGTTFTIGFKR